MKKLNWLVTSLFTLFLFAQVSPILGQQIQYAHNSEKSNSGSEKKESEKEQLNDSLLVLQKTIEDNSSSTSEKLAISGFIDFNYFTSREKKAKLEYGQFEVDFSAKLIKDLSFEAAIALDDESIVPAAGYLDYHFAGDEEGHGARGEFFTHSGIHIGQFDTPFGKYYEQIPSPNRNISTVPTVIQNSINCLNTFGVNFYTNISFAQINIFILNGLIKGYIVGGRTGVRIIDDFELGLSVLNSFDSGYRNTTLVGADFSFNSRLVEISAELIHGNALVKEASLLSNSPHLGYYIESKLLASSIILMPLDFIVRFGNCYSESSEILENKVSHFDITLSYSFHPQLVLKLEYHQFNTNNHPTENNFGIQAVVSF